MNCPKCGGVVQQDPQNEDCVICYNCKVRYPIRALRSQSKQNLQAQHTEQSKSKVFSFKSGTDVMIDNNKIEISRNSGKAAAKTLFMGRAGGNMVIFKSKVSGIIHDADFLFICASGLPLPSDFKISNISDVKQYPNCIVAKERELKELYDYLIAHL